MSTITLTLPDEDLSRLNHLAIEAGTSPEEWLTDRIEGLLEAGADDLDVITQYLLKKNAELYRRLA